MSSLPSHRIRFLSLPLVALIGLFAAISLGSVSIPISDTLSVLAGESLENPAYENIIEKIRLPKAITAAAAGSSLAVAGLLMQTLFRNPLADPFVLGINSGASLGVALVVLAGGSGYFWAETLAISRHLSLVVAAAAGAAVMLSIVLHLSRRVEIMTLLIVGLMIGYATNAMVSILMYLSIPEQLQAYISWTFGDFSGVEWKEMPLFLGTCGLGIFIAFLCSKPLNAFQLGETYAKSLGVNTTYLRRGLLCSGALLAGAVTAFCGPIGFIGIAVPHLCRAWLQTSDHRLLMPACLFAGAAVALGAEVVSQLPGTQVTFPLNAVTALMGAPVILWVLLRQKKWALAS